MWFKETQTPSHPAPSLVPAPSRLPAGKGYVALLVLFAVVATIGEPGSPAEGSDPVGAATSSSVAERPATRPEPPAPLDESRSLPGPAAPAVAAPAGPAVEFGPAESSGLPGDSPPGDAPSPGPEVAPVVPPPVVVAPPAEQPAGQLASPQAEADDRSISRRATTSRSAVRTVEVPKAREWLRPLFVRYAREANVAPELLMALAWRESSWRVGARSDKGAVGVMQLMPDTVEFTSLRLLGRSRQLDPRNAESNIRMGARFLAHLLERFDGDLNVALAAYHQGTTSVLRHGRFSVSRRFAASVLALRGSFAT